MKQGPESWHPRDTQLRRIGRSANFPYISCLPFDQQIFQSNKLDPSEYSMICSKAVDYDCICTLGGQQTQKKQFSSSQSSFLLCKRIFPLQTIAEYASMDRAKAWGQIGWVQTFIGFVLFSFFDQDNALALYKSKGLLIILYQQAIMIRLLSHPRQQIPIFVDRSPPVTLYVSIQELGDRACRLCRSIEQEQDEIIILEQRARSSRDPHYCANIKMRIREAQYQIAGWQNEIDGARVRQSMKITDILGCYSEKVDERTSTAEQCFITLQQHWILIFTGTEIFSAEIQARENLANKETGDQFEQCLMYEHNLCVGLANMKEIYKGAQRFLRYILLHSSFQHLNKIIKKAFSSQITRAIELLLRMSISQAKNRDTIAMIRSYTNAKEGRLLPKPQARKATESELFSLLEYWNSIRSMNFSNISALEAFQIFDQSRNDLLMGQDLRTNKNLIEEQLARNDFWDILESRLNILHLQGDPLGNATRRKEVITFQSMQDRERQNWRRDLERNDRQDQKFGTSIYRDLIDVASIVKFRRQLRQPDNVVDSYQLKELARLEDELIKLRRQEIVDEWIKRGGF